MSKKIWIKTGIQFHILKTGFILVAIVKVTFDLQDENLLFLSLSFPFSLPPCVGNGRDRFICSSLDIFYRRVSLSQMRTFCTNNNDSDPMPCNNNSMRTRDAKRKRDREEGLERRETRWNARKEKWQEERRRYGQQENETMRVQLLYFWKALIFKSHNNVKIEERSSSQLGEFK